MALTTEAELLAALAENDLKIAQAIAIYSALVSDWKWKSNIGEIIALRGSKLNWKANWPR